MADFYSVQESAKILGKSVATIKRMCADKRLSAVRDGKTWKITPESIRELIVELSVPPEFPERRPIAPTNREIRERREQQRERQRQREQRQQNEDESDEPDETEPIENRIIVGNRMLPRVESERVIKQEEAIKRQRENLIREGKLIDISKVREVMELHYTALLGLWEELIDVWSIKLNLPPEKSREMLAEYKVSLAKTWRKIRSDVEPGEMPDQSIDDIPGDGRENSRSGGVLVNA